jgi:hypothetical protein
MVIAQEGGASAGTYTHAYMHTSHTPQLRRHDGGSGHPRRLSASPRLWGCRAERRVSFCAVVKRSTTNVFAVYHRTCERAMGVLSRSRAFRVRREALRFLALRCLGTRAAPCMQVIIPEARRGRRSSRRATRIRRRSDDVPLLGPLSSLVRSLVQEKHQKARRATSPALQGVTYTTSRRATTGFAATSSSRDQREAPLWPKDPIAPRCEGGAGGLHHRRQ